MPKFYEHIREDGTVEYRNVDYDVLMEELSRQTSNDEQNFDIPVPTDEDNLNVVLHTRKRAYPPIEDFVDAWVKQDEAALEEYRQKCLDVKAAYPKPE